MGDTHAPSACTTRPRALFALLSRLPRHWLAWRHAHHSSACRLHHLVHSTYVPGSRAHCRGLCSSSASTTRQLESFALLRHLPRCLLAKASWPWLFRMAAATNVGFSSPPWLACATLRLAVVLGAHHVLVVASHHTLFYIHK